MSPPARPAYGHRIEGACYFLASPDGRSSPHASEFTTSIQELVDMIEKAQGEDGYLNIYFTVVDPEGRFRNLRDMHEMCEWRRADFAPSPFPSPSLSMSLALRTRSPRRQRGPPRRGRARALPPHWLAPAPRRDDQGGFVRSCNAAMPM